MSKLKPTIDLGYPTEAHGDIPSFANIEEEAEFWDTHDSMVYLEGVEPIRLPRDQQCVYRLVVTLGKVEQRMLTDQAQALGISPAQLARHWIVDQLH